MSEKVKFKDVQPELVEHLVNPKDAERVASLRNGRKMKIHCPVCQTINEKMVKTFVKNGLDRKNCDYCNSFEAHCPDKMKYLVNKEDGKLTNQSHKRVMIQCPDCDFQKEMIVQSLSRRGFSCDNCKSLQAKHPGLLIYLVNKEDGKLTHKSNKKIAVKCPDCDFQKEMFVSNLSKQGFSCDNCKSLQTKRPDLIKYLVNKEDAKLTYGSGKKIKVQCPDCSFQKEMTVDKLSRRGFSCSLCCDNISTPEKFVGNILKQLELTFEKEYCPKWSLGRRYDFYIDDLNTVVEVHGIQHYEQSPRGRILEEEKGNDRLKMGLAEENGILNYIVIDARKSEKEFLTGSIKQTLDEILDLSKVDFDLAWEYSQKSIVAQVAKDYQEGALSRKDVAKKHGINENTVTNYVKKMNVELRNKRQKPIVSD